MKLTPAKVIEELEGEIEVYRASYRNRNGKVRDRGALRTIQALKQAIQAVKQTTKNENTD